MVSACGHWCRRCLYLLVSSSNNLRRLANFFLPIVAIAKMCAQTRQICHEFNWIYSFFLCVCVFVSTYRSMISDHKKSIIGFFFSFLHVHTKLREMLSIEMISNNEKIRFDVLDGIYANNWIVALQS